MVSHYKAPFPITEKAQAHGRSIEKEHNYIDAIATTGVHAIKFQIHISEVNKSKGIGIEAFSLKKCFG
ncbi:MAG: hypothetical protein COZ75_07700 [Flavobacteriaceae bacterium CG_4_8_14_3_um_filter_34_10]|nr:hypothetical protein [Flavobacteriia bacterium]OIP50121.1 MAG: hypothetical protein AUK33_08185 [Flavobacteriaceae bacterium CG2_30_34_30]PIQ18313.1 MAG: hypothetical protein COW66_07020 [Flavobacteriaceae bacterium CG18_big_fil_WC_8_21_14_2_50_34_36]PIV49452.1 MAG: hypothetical protein COS19_08965 [Flavobacteriaceae bacterium CG02_land_8_20_14_3_00_34_13]PIX09264.1 MAG: hypothetical protein COZ75_07700 [Flavobacteriaceae bacterium CG_4_8_14_3_um_filter_34_10]PIZ07769.1 MAG: hypothetical pr